MGNRHTMSIPAKTQIKHVLVWERKKWHWARDCPEDKHKPKRGRYSNIAEVTEQHAYVVDAIPVQQVPTLLETISSTGLVSSLSLVLQTEDEANQMAYHMYGFGEGILDSGAMNWTGSKGKMGIIHQQEPGAFAPPDTRIRKIIGYGAPRCLLES